MKANRVSVFGSLPPMLCDTQTSGNWSNPDTLVFCLNYRCPVNFSFHLS